MIDVISFLDFFFLSSCGILFQLSLLAAISERWLAIIFHYAAPNRAYSRKTDPSLLGLYAKYNLNSSTSNN